MRAFEELKTFGGYAEIPANTNFALTTAVLLRVRLAPLILSLLQLPWTHRRQEEV